MVQPSCIDGMDNARKTQTEPTGTFPRGTGRFVLKILRSDPLGANGWRTHHRQLVEFEYVCELTGPALSEGRPCIHSPQNNSIQLTETGESVGECAILRQ
jgi:hypothetical protein